jgi:hypothetical protein
MKCRNDAPILPRDDPASAPGTIAHAGVDPTLNGRALQQALQRDCYPPWLLQMG